MADPPPTYNESLQQQGPAYGGFQPSYGTVPGPQSAQPAGSYPAYGGYPRPSGPYTQQPAGAYTQPPAGAYGKPGVPPPGQYHHHQPRYQGSNVTSYQSNIVVSQYPTQSVVLVGGCPSCRVGVLEDDFTCLGVVCAILFFPLGILCCLAMRQRRCAHCGAVFG
ncbi:Brain protein i3 [Plakobranchus ocellatus]|uniref:Membrane protein BRI3 n=1 Tax=Plakobranchus ocellatus TaxID=259542 RepID=A0AAV4B7I2_9GAST|nr:Brain protein i3 [Plakobranchus ocellatus]